MKRSVLAALAVVVLAGIAVLGATATAGRQTNAHNPRHAMPGVPVKCKLDHGVKHVVYLIFDNVHFLRDNPNVPSDLEQMPHLLNFIRGNGRCSRTTTPF